MKTRFDIEIKDSENICGGYLTTTEPMTKKQVVKYMAQLGRELMKNNRHINRVKYSAWEADNDDIENAECVFAIISRSGRGVFVTSY